MLFFLLASSSCFLNEPPPKKKNTLRNDCYLQCYLLFISIVSMCNWSIFLKLSSCAVSIDSLLERTEKLYLNLHGLWTTDEFCQLYKAVWASHRLCSSLHCFWQQPAVNATETDDTTTAENPKLALKESQWPSIPFGIKTCSSCCKASSYSHLSQKQHGSWSWQQLPPMLQDTLLRQYMSF